MKVRPSLDAIGLVDGPATHVLRSGRQIPVRVSVLPLRDSTHRPLYIVFVQNDVRQRELEASLEERQSFEMLLAELSARFSGLAEEKLDGEIEFWLRRLVEMLDGDRGALAEVSSEGGLKVTHSYAAPGVEPYPTGIADEALPWLTSQLKAGRAAFLTRIPEDLPDEAVVDRCYFTGAGIKSAIAIPIHIGGALVCVLAFCTFRHHWLWPQDVVSRLDLAGGVFANAIARRQAKQRLDQKRIELAHVARVASMGELASVIAHELDQPLTAIVSNAQAVRYLLKVPRPDFAEADEALQDVIDSAMRASEIVHRERRLLRKSQITAEPFDVNDSVREIELFIRAEARQEGAALALELVPGLPPVAGDRIQVQQVI
jgi:hypothetical protein